jgi:hypothetical protein
LALTDDGRLIKEMRNWTGTRLTVRLHKIASVTHEAACRDALSPTALVQRSVPQYFMTEPFNFFFQMRLATPQFNEHLAVVIRATEQCLVDLIFEPLNISNMGWLCHNSLLTLGLTLSIKQSLERECVGTKFSEVIAGRSICKLVLASFFSATCRAKPLEILHDVRVSILKSLWIDVEGDKHFQQQICSVRSLPR